MRVRLRFWALLLATVWIVIVSASCVAGRVLDTRLHNLTQGVNLAHWFAQAELTQETFQTRITASDLQLIRSMGFRHVRLPIDPTVLFDEENPAKLNPENLRDVDAAIDLILNHQLAVIVDLHPKREFKRKLYQDEAFQAAVGQFWQTFAQHLSSHSPDRLFLEVLNEPDTRDPQIWYSIQEKLLAAMREGAPNHTLIASANLRVEDDWNTIQALTELTPVPDRNVVYNFHFYTPMTFTHQGASWGEETWQYLHDVPYPSTPEAIAPVLPKIENERARSWLEDYGENRWNATKLDEMIHPAVEWAQSHQVHLTCNEFGVYRHHAPPGDRTRWMRDVRTVLEKYDIGWAVWEYDAGFGIIRERGADRTPDRAILQALMHAH